MREQSRMVFLTGQRLKMLKNVKKEEERKDAPLKGETEDKRVAQTANS